MESYLLFTLFYFLLTICIIFPPTEFVSVGLTVESIFSRWLKSYLFGLKHLLPNQSIWDGNLAWQLYVATAITIPLVAATIITSWHRYQWGCHPVAKALMNFTNTENTINRIARDINIEYLSVNKIILKCNSVTKVVATDNWILKVSPYMLNVAHQSDVLLTVISSDNHKYVPDRLGGVQYLNIEVKCQRPNFKPFHIRINSVDFKDLQQKVLRPIIIPNDVVVHKTLTDSFLDTFRQQVADNPSLPAPPNLDVCIGCMQSAPNVKLNTCCGDTSGPQACTACYCRPMWCIDCMGKWFASRQDQDRPNTWLSSKCTCPMCRSRFCILDVCPLHPVDGEGDG